MGGRLKEKQQEKIYQEDTNRKKAGIYVDNIYKLSIIAGKNDLLQIKMIIT